MNLFSVLKYTLYSSLAMACSLPTFAASSTDNGSVDQIFSFSSRNKTYVSHTSPANVTTECSTNDYMVLEGSNPMSSDLLSILLTAQTSNNPRVIIYVDGCDEANRAVIDAVRIKRIE